MEILIFGGILVALMAFVSTKIKKSAARAFERETIENEDFKIIKPEGFLSPVNENSKFAFEARSKDTGKNDAGNFRQAQVTLSVFSNSKFETICAKAKKTADKILSERVFENAESQKTCLIEGEETKNGVKIFTLWKIVENIRKRKIYELQISTLENYKDEFQARVGELLESFAVK